ncbi:MAG: hypothetical protein JO250_18855 [Armatimonadetes bacterium]|nr:hypothetical protein [Armatimonadota bacterium]
MTGPRPVQGDQAAAGTPVVSGAADGGDLPRRFTREIWPLLTRPGANCVACHSKGNPSQLHFPADALSSYHQLLTEGRLDPHSPSSLLARVTATDLSQRMPPSGIPAWTEAEKARLRDFMNAVAQSSGSGTTGPLADEQFPPALLLPYTGHRPPLGQDTTLLSYYQLRHKIATLFGDDWRRGNRDQYLENLAQLGGADFVTRFDESTRPTPAYLSAVSALAADVASRAYLNKTGPFAGRPEAMPLPGPGQDAAVRGQITRLYQRLLFRAPSARELGAAAGLLRAVAAAPAPPAPDTGPLMFQVVARDDDGQETTQQATVAITPAGTGVNTFFVNENSGEATPEARLGVWNLRPGDPSQRLVLSNADTVGRVTFQSLTLRGPLPSTAATVIGSDAASVEGAWSGVGPNARDGYTDGGDDKGVSRLTVPLRVDKPGRYELVLTWRKNADGAASVPVTVYAPGPSRLALPPAPPLPPPGQAQYVLDQTVDGVPFWDVGTAFQFNPRAPQSGVEITNRGTRKRVVADAVSFIPQASDDNTPALIVRSNDARGHEKWPIFKPTDFTPYNTIGPDLRSDDNAHKGELSLLYAPTAALPAGRYYHLRVNYPGHVDNESRVPVTVYARRSSPIVRLRAPTEAPVGARVTLDATASYNVQHSPLHFTWSQIGGPFARMSGAHGPTLEVQVTPEAGAQRAWEGLCRALVLHPDFLFTRPRSLAATRDPATRRRLQLVKLAQDLVGRPPTAAEVRRLDGGATLSALADHYLAGPEFETFYFRRVRLYLESHGTPTQDEPARLWSYLLRTGRPYTELLTADYTITPDGRRVPRPAYCGHSGVLTMPGFIEGKPGLPHFNYAAQVCEKFLGYVFEVTPAVVKARGTLTAASTTDPSSICYSCHQVLTPLAYQRTRWTDDGQYRQKDESGRPIDDSDRHAVAGYPFQGEGLEAFALAAQRKERFHRAIIQTHFLWYFGRQMRYDADERGLYRRLWNEVHRTHFALKPLVRAIVTSPEYLGAPAPPPAGLRLAYRPRRSSP